MNKSLTFRLSLLSLGLLSAGIAIAADPSPFAEVPLRLQNTTTTTGGQVKPNVLFLLDDSGSMAECPFADFTYPRYVHETIQNGRKITAGNYCPIGRAVQYKAFDEAFAIELCGDKRWKNTENRREDYYNVYYCPADVRWKIAKQVTVNMINKYKDNVNFGIESFNARTHSGERNGPTYYDYFTDDKAKLDYALRRFGASGSTPSTLAYMRATKIIRDHTFYRCQQNYIIMMSDGDSTGEGGMNTGYNPEWPSSNPGMDRYIDQTTGKPFREYFGMLPAHYKADEGNGNGISFYSKKLAKYDFKTVGVDAAGVDWNDPTFPPQTATTFTVGFGAGISEKGKRYLRDAVEDPNEDFMSALSPEKLEDSFNKIFSKITGGGSKFKPTRKYSAVAPSIAGDPNGIGAAIATFLDSASWSSQLRIYKTDNAGRIADKNVYTTPSYANRKTLINTGEKIEWVTGADDSYADNDFFGLFNSGDNKEWSNTFMPWVARIGSDNDIQSTVNSAHYQNADKSARQYRIRNTASTSNPPSERDMGDVLDAPVLTIGDSKLNGKELGRPEFMVTAANDGMVYLFRSQDDANHLYDLKLNYIPAGMERQSRTDTMSKIFNQTIHPSYGTENPHVYGVNGGIVLRYTDRGTDVTPHHRQIFMVGSMGQGGRGIYALNIGGNAVNSGEPVGLNLENSADWKTSVPLFESAKGTSNGLGYTFGAPQLARISTQREVDGKVRSYGLGSGILYGAFLSSGYSNPYGDETALYVYNAIGQDMGLKANGGVANGGTVGQQIAKIIVENGVGGLSEPALVDIDGDGLAEIAYAGDKGGNMYRFDLRNSNPAQWNATKIYAAVTETKNGIITYPQPITAAPAVSRQTANKYVVVFGTGSDIYQTDLVNKDQQAVYGIYDSIPSISNTQPIPETPTQPIPETPIAATKNDLQQQSWSCSGEYCNLTSELVDEKTKKGWYFNLNADGKSAGERVVIKPIIILRTVILATRVYSSAEETSTINDPCLGNDSKTVNTKAFSNLMQFRAQDGGMVTKRDAHIGLSRTNTSALYSSVKSEGFVTPALYRSGQDCGGPCSATPDGEVGGSGIDAALKPGGSASGNTCFKSGELDSKVYVSGTEYGVANPYDVQGLLCPGVINRLSWREIF